MRLIRLIYLAVLTLLMACTAVRGPQVGFELKIFDPTGATLKAMYTETSPGGVLEPFAWRSAGDGNCIELSFFGRPDGVNIADHDIVQLRLIAEPYATGGTITDTVFTGKVLERPDPRASGAVEYRVLGLKEWLNWIRQNFILPNTNIQDIVNTYIKPSLPAFISGQAANVGSGFGSRPLSLGPTNVAFALDDLAKSAIVGAGTKSVTWGVDREGKLFFKQPTDSTTIPYANVWLDPEKLRISSDQLVTAATLVLGQSDPSDGYGEEYRKPHVISYRVQAANHGTYQRETVQSVSNAVFEIAPAIVNWFRGNSGMSSVPYTNNPGNVLSYGPADGGSDYSFGFLASGTASGSDLAALSDPDQSTFWDVPVTTGGSAPTDRTRMWIEATPPAGYIVVGATWNVEAAGRGISEEGLYSGLQVFVVGALPPSTVGDVDQTAIAVSALDSPPSTQVLGRYKGSAVLWGKASSLQGTYQTKVQMRFRTFWLDGGVSDFPIRIYNLRLICVKMDVLDQAAKSLLRPPSAVAEKVIIPGYLHPFGVLNISGSPSGTITGDATEYSYTYSSKRGIETTIMIGTTGASESARVMRLLASGLDTAAGVTARIYADRR